MKSENAKRNPHQYGDRKCPKDPGRIEIAILEVLALKETSWVYELTETYKIGAKNTVYAALGCLFERGMIQEINDPKLCVALPSASKPFEISTYGLIAALYYQRSSEIPKSEEPIPRRPPEIPITPKQKTPTLWKVPPIIGSSSEISIQPNLKTATLWREINTVAMIHGQKLPLIFGKWAYFKKNGWEDIVFLSLMGTIKSSQIMPIILYQQDDPDTKELIELGVIKPVSFEDRVSRLVEMLNRQVLFPEPTPSLDYFVWGWGEPSGWENTLLEDKDLRKFIFNQIIKRKESHRREIKQLNLWKKCVDAIKE